MSEQRSALPTALLTPLAEPAAARRSRALGGILFIVAGLVRAGYSWALDGDVLPVLIIGGVIEAGCLSAGYVMLLRGRLPGTSMAARVTALILAAVYAVQLVLSALIAVDGVFFISLFLGFAAFITGIVYAVVAMRNPELPQPLQRLPLALFVGLILTSFMLAGEAILAWIVSGLIYAGFGLAVVLLSRSTAPAAGSSAAAASRPAATVPAPSPAAPAPEVPVAAAVTAAPAPPAPVPAPAVNAPPVTAAPVPPPAPAPRAAAPSAPPAPPAPAAAAPTAPIAGWYADPAGGGGLRLWDGAGWTEETRPWPEGTPRS